MSAQVHDVGSIVDFWPDPVPARPGGVPEAGTALVVVERRQMVVRTELRRVHLFAGHYVFDEDPSAQRSAEGAHINEGDQVDG